LALFFEYETPFGVLGKEDDIFDAATFAVHTGIPSIAQVLIVATISSIAIMILVNLAKLLIVNHPRIAYETKANIVDLTSTICFIALLPLILDVIYTVIVKIFY
jgi:hypothetical protein